MRLVEALLSMANGYRMKVKLPTKPGMIIIDFYDKDNFSITYEGVKSRFFKDEFSFGTLLRHLNDEVEIVEDRCECIDEDVEIIEEETENAFTGCKWFVRGKETMSMDYEDSENWFKAKELIESLSFIEKTEEEKDIEELDVALLAQCDNWLRCPTNKVTKQDIELNPYIIDNIRENTLYFQNKINKLVKEVNKLKNRKEEK